MSYYKIINGVRYDRGLLEAAEAAAQGRGEYRISLEEIQQIVQRAADAQKITAIEWRTLHYIANHFHLTAPASQWLAARFGQHGPGDSDEAIRRVVREDYGLLNLDWKIDAAEVGRQQGAHPAQGFESVLERALEAFLRWNQGQLSLAAVVSRRDLAYNLSPTPEEILKEYLDQGTLILVPKAQEAQATLDFDLPESIDLETFWIFGLYIPELFPLLFVAFVNRHQAGQFSQGYFSKKPDIDSLVHDVVRHYAHFSKMEWRIEPTETERQLNLSPGQNFGNALFAALHNGIFNGESSFSFRDFIQQEIWADPDKPIQAYQSEYVETGKLRLLSQADDPEFPVPDAFWPGLAAVWVFGLEMPHKTHVRFVVTADRDARAENASWNDGFIWETLSFEERIREVVSREFGAEGLKWRISEAEYEAQRLQYGPEWRYFAGLLRQALNTALHDHITPRSLFNIIGEIHRAEVHPELFDDPFEYRAAIKHRIQQYLKTGFIEFLPAGFPDGAPAAGEQVEDNWLFLLLLPDMSDHAFFIVLPRRPDDGQLPYNYGVN